MLITARDEGGAEILAGQLVAALQDRCAFTVVVPSVSGMGALAARLSSAARVVPLPLHSARGTLASVAAIRRLAREADVVHLNSNHPASRLAAAAAFAVGTCRPLVSVEHSGTPLSAVELPRWYAPIAGPLFRASRRHAARFVAVSAENERRLAESYGIDASRATVVHNGIDLAPFASSRDRREAGRRAIGAGPADKIVVVAARQAANKGHRHLVEAARTVVARVPGVRFVLAGAGERDPGVALSIGQAGLGHTFHDRGFLPHEEMIDAICAADVLALPSLAEGFPLVLLEAMAAGVIPVSSAVGGAPELIEDGRNGFLVPPGNAEALASAIVRALRLPADQREAVAAAARERAACFSIGATAGKMMEVYRRASGLTPAPMMRGGISSCRTSVSTSPSSSTVRQASTLKR